MDSPILIMIGFLFGVGFAFASVINGMREAVKDARRYRFIRNHRGIEIVATRASLDNAIDTAMARDREG